MTHLDNNLLHVDLLLDVSCSNCSVPALNKTGDIIQDLCFVLKLRPLNILHVHSQTLSTHNTSLGEQEGRKV